MTEMFVVDEVLTPDARTLYSLLTSRFSCRAFRNETVDQQVILAMLNIAQRTATWCNSQPWQLIITSGAATERLREAYYEKASQSPLKSDIPFPERYSGVYRDRRRECAMALYESLGIKADDRQASGEQALENFRFFGAPHVAIITSPKELGTYGAIDCGAYVSTFLAAAQSMGVSAIPQASLAMQSEFLHGYFAISEDRNVVCGISFGYARSDHPANNFRTARANVGDAVAFITE